MRTFPVSRRGNAIVEFAIGFGLLLSIFAAVMQLGYTLYAYNALETAVRNGARYASILTYDGDGGGSEHSSAVKNMVVFGAPDPPAGAKPVVPGLAVGDVGVLVERDAKNIPHRVMVRINLYDSNRIFGSTPLVNKPAATFEYMGRYMSP